MTAADLTDCFTAANPHESFVLLAAEGTALTLFDSEGTDYAHLMPGSWLRCPAGVGIFWRETPVGPPAPDAVVQAPA